METFDTIDMIHPETEIKEGFKKTKIGWIPDEWGFCYLEKLAKRGSGHTPNKERYDFYNGDIKWISLADSSKLDKGIIDETEKCISQLGIENSSAIIHSKGTVLISRDAGVGKSAVMGRSMAVSQHFITWKTDDKTYHNWFLYFWLQFRKKEFERIAVGSTIKTIGLPYFKKLKVPVPPLPEQHKIAEILSTWDQAINHTQNLISRLKLRKKGLMQQLLTTKSRIAGFNGEWTNMMLKEITDRITTRNEELNDNVVTISAQRGLVRQEDFFNKRVASEVLSDYYLIKKGHFAYNKSYSNGYPMGAFKRLDNFEKAVVTTLYICFELKKNVNSDFILYFFEAGLMIPNLMKIAQEGGRAHGLLNISLSDFFSLRLSIPTLEEQNAIANVLSTADNEIKAYENYLAQLQSQKRGLMQQLLTGQKRVKC